MIINNDLKMLDEVIFLRKLTVPFLQAFGVQLGYSGTMLVTRDCTLYSCYFTVKYCIKNLFSNASPTFYINTINHFQAL